MADSTIPQPTDPQVQINALKAQIQKLQTWQDQRDIQQIQFPLDRTSRQVIGKELGIY